MIDAYQVRRSISEGSHRFISEHPGVLHITIDDAPDLTSGLPRNALPEALSKGPREAWADMDIDTEPLAVPFDKMNKGLNELRAIVRERRSSTDLIRVVAASPLRNGPFQQQLNHLWEGMRPHPYDDEQRAAAIMSLSRFCPTLGVFPLEEGLGPDRVAHELLDCPLEIEMGLIGGGSTRACVSTFSLWRP